jgi:hypothetical protein
MRDAVIIAALGFAVGAGVVIIHAAVVSIVEAL